MTKGIIPISNPMLTGNEKAYVMDCLESSWISSTGKYVGQFEAAFADFCGVKHAVSCCNGTAALHLALMALGLEPGDEVIVPTLTFVATANAVAYCGGKPVFVDSESDTWNINPALIESKISSRTRGIIVVHFRGQPADMDPIIALAKRRGLFVVEDAAQSHGAEYKGRRTGSLGDIGTFSFFGNKIVTTGEGGIVVTNNDVLASKIRVLKDHGMDRKRPYWHPIVGHNYRMTNVAAAIGLAQLEKIEGQIKGRAEIASWYQEYFKKIPEMEWQREKEWAKRVWFLFVLVLDRDTPSIRDELIPHLLKHGIDTRPLYYPLHTLPPYSDKFQEDSFPVAERISRRGFSLPTWVGLTRDDVRYISETILDYVHHKKGI